MDVWIHRLILLKKILCLNYIFHSNEACGTEDFDYQTYSNTKRSGNIKYISIYRSV